jgi:lipoate-protein ligase A
MSISLPALMRVDSTVLIDPKANLDHDDELLRRAEAGEGEVIRFWESPSYFVVLGRTGREEDDVDLDSVRRDNIPVLRRSSGGGTVLQGPGCLNFSIVLSKKERPALESISASYRYILDKVIKAMADLGVEAVFRPVSDLALASTDKKFSGNAQRRGRNYILHHGTILYAFNLTLVAKFLKVPKKMPEYRNARSHAAFVTNIPARPEDIRRVISAYFA